MHALERPSPPGSSHATDEPAIDAVPHEIDAAALRARLEGVRRRIEAACRTAGRDPASVRLVAVSKFHPAAAVEAAMRAGLREFGENRVQEAAAKFGAAPRADGRRLHVIGALQTNKAREAVRIADAIGSLDRARLADALEAAVQAEGRCPDLLVQVNVGDEAQKAGVAVGAADAFIGQCRARFGNRLVGLMCIPPAGEDPRPGFRTLAGLARAHGLATLSMGMSDDLEAAIELGSTEVRIGTAIFGPRRPSVSGP